jgi:hypothetical protein
MQSTAFPLPDRWSPPARVEDTVVADRIELRRVGFSTVGPSGEELTGAAADAVQSPVERSYFELLERVATVEALGAPRASYDFLNGSGEQAGSKTPGEVFQESGAPSRWRFARSNGVALHASWRDACQRAHWELAERDRVLRAWYGETRPEPLALPCATTSLAASSSFEWVGCSFPASHEAEFSQGLEVVGVFGLPRRADLPLICGYGARPTSADAVVAAVSEALQLLGFLWDEPVIQRLPAPAPTPAYHLEHHQWPPHRHLIRRWLDEGHTRFWKAARPRRHSSAPLGFVDLTPGWMCGGLRVAKAICEAAEPLSFGETPSTCHLPGALRIHPIA